MLFAVHLPEGALPMPWCVAGYVVAIALASLGCWRLHERDIPRLALTSAAFFVASSIHAPMPGGSVHLVLNGLVGILLGFRAGIALFVGLLLQAILINHGGRSLVGVNVVLQALPAIAIGAAFHLFARKRRSINALAICGGLLGSTGVVATIVLQSGLLWWAGDGEPIASLFWLGMHVPVSIAEGFLVGFMVHYLARVKPELIGVTVRPEASVENAVMASDEIR